MLRELALIRDAKAYGPSDELGQWVQDSGFVPLTTCIRLLALKLCLREVACQ